MAGRGRLTRALLAAAPGPIRRAVAAWQGQRSAYMGAAMSRLTADWITAATRSADRDILADLRTLRARSRDLARNSSIGARIATVFAEQVIGEHGIRLQSQATTGGKPDTAARTAVEHAWVAFTRPGACTTERALSWLDLEWLAMRSIVVDGEFLALKRRGDRRFPHWYGLQPIDPDQLDATYEGRTEQGNLVRGGVEFDERGHVVAYWIWRHHPYDGQPNGNVRDRIDAADVFHLYVSDRVAQRRGVPWMAPILTTLRHLDGYIEAEVIAARTAAAKMGWIVNEGTGLGPDLDDETGAMGRPALEAEPGAIDRLAPGEKFVGWDPQHPTAAFRDFLSAQLHAVAAAVGVSYATLTGDMREANYSSARVGMLTERRRFERLQSWLREALHKQVFPDWLRWALTAGQVRGYTIADYAKLLPHRWQPSGFQWVDPAKEMEGAAYEIALGIQSRTRLAAERGRDFEEVLDELKEEAALIEAAGVQLPQPGLPHTQTLETPPATDAAPAKPRALRAVGGSHG